MKNLKQKKVVKKVVKKKAPKLNTERKNKHINDDISVISPDDFLSLFEPNYIWSVS